MPYWAHPWITQAKISELENMLVETSKTEIHRRRRKKKKTENRVSKKSGPITKSITYM